MSYPLRLLFASLLAIYARQAVADELREGLSPPAYIGGHVTQVLSGDTIMLQVAGDSPPGEYRVHLAQIDAPERVQAFGYQAFLALERVVLFQSVTVLVTAVDDNHNDPVGQLILEGKDLNLWLVRNGLAWVDRERVLDPRYTRAEHLARTEMRGLWSSADPTPPWAFRLSN